MGARQATLQSQRRDIVTPRCQARISRADFQPPPELADRDPALAPAEHVGGVRTELRLHEGVVGLGRTYYQNPLRVLMPVAERPGSEALLFLMNSTAGLLDGDGQLVELDVGSGVRCFVTNQSASRVHPCPLWHAAARFDIKLVAGSTLCVLPGPTIPFAGSRYHQRTNISLEPGANMVWGDILLPGRTQYAKAPERFAFDCIVQELRVERGSRLVFHERFCWRGPWTEDAIGWHFGDAEAVASLFVSGKISIDELPELSDGVIAVQPTAHGDTCLRLVGRNPEQLIATAARVALMAAAQLAGDPAPWLAHSSRLAANHWFSEQPE